MKKDWKDIEGQLVRIDIGSTFTEAQSDSTDAGIICFTTDGHIVLNGTDYVFDTYKYKENKQTTDWVRKYVQQGDAEHPFLRGRMDADAFTYNIGWMLDGYTYNESVKIPLISEEQQGLVDSQSYTDYLQPLLKGEYDDNIDAIKNTLNGKVGKEDKDYKRLQSDVDWLGNYVMTDRTNVGYPFLKYRVDTTAKTLNIGWYTMAGYAETIKIPLVDDTQNSFFDPYYYEEFIQPLFNGDFAYKTELDALQTEVDKKVDNDFEYSQVKHAADWCGTYVLGDQTGSEHPFLRYRVDTDKNTLNIGNMLDGFTYAENVSIPLIDDTNGVFFDPYYYQNYIQPLFNDEYALQRDVDKKVDKVDGKSLSSNDFTDFYKVKLDNIDGNANRYVLPTATKDELGGVKVGGDVRTETNSFALEGAPISREIDGTILVRHAFASKRGAEYDIDGAMSKAQVRKLYEIEAKAQVNKIEGIKVNGVPVSIGEDKTVNIIVSGGGGSTDTDALQALMEKVAQMQAEIDDLKNKLCLTYE